MKPHFLEEEYLIKIDMIGEIKKKEVLHYITIRAILNETIKNVEI